MRKFGRAAVTAAGAVSLASLASLLSITVPASAYTTGSAAPAPAATRLGTLARIKPGGPMALPRNQSSAPRAFYGKTINVVSQNWGGYVAQRHGSSSVMSGPPFSFLMLTAQARHPAFPGIGGPGCTENNSGAVLDQPTQIFRGKAFDCYWMAQG